MYTREAYPGEPGILFHYLGTDPQVSWPRVAPDGISMANGHVLVEHVPFTAPGSSGEQRLTNEEMIYLTGMSVGLRYETLSERYPHYFPYRNTATAGMRNKFNIGDIDNKALIAQGFHHGICNIVRPAMLTAIHPNHRQSLVDVNRLAGMGNTIQQAGALTGRHPSWLSEATRDALADLDLGFVTNRPNALLMAIGMGRLLLNPYMSAESVTPLPKLTQDEMEVAFPTKMLHIRPMIMDSSAVIRLSGQHPNATIPDWERGRIESFSYKNATFEIGDTEKAGLSNIELAAWVHHCIGVSQSIIFDTVATKYAFGSAIHKIVNQATINETDRDRRLLFNTSISKACEQGIIIPVNERPRALKRRISNPALLLDAADLVTTHTNSLEVNKELIERGHDVTVKHGILKLKRALGVAHAGQLVLLAEAVRQTIDDSA